MLQELHDSLKAQLLAINGLVTRPHVSAEGRSVDEGLNDFLLDNRYFAGLRLTEKYLMVYLMPLYDFPDLDTLYGERLKPVRNGKSCLKITKPRKLDRDAVNAILEQGVLRWKSGQ